MTLVFVVINKAMLRYRRLFNYFILQEVLGLVFLLFTAGYLQLLVIFFKIGVAPLHFWVFRVLNGVYGFNLMWFLTFQKLPFLVILLQLMDSFYVVLLLVGLLVCLMQMLLMKSYKNLLILSSTESFNWVVVGYVMSFLSVFVIFMYYFILMLYIIPKFEEGFGLNYIGWETMLVFINLPLSVNFYVKIFALSELLHVFNVWVLIILFLMFMSVLSLGYWIVNLSVLGGTSFKYRKFGFYVFFPMMFVVLL